MQIIGVIPARYASTRLPAKLLLDLDGQSVLERTYRQACKAKTLNKVIIATDNPQIYQAAKEFGAEVYMTKAEHQSGTDRIAELAESNPEWTIIVNIQADEPFINPEDINSVAQAFIKNPKTEIASLYHRIQDPEEIANPNNIKVVTGLDSNALYFSRSIIPHERDQGSKPVYKKHVGLYGYRRDVLLELSNLPPSELEQSEKLEQLRALANGFKIQMIESKSISIGIDTQADYTAALLKLKSLRKL